MIYSISGFLLLICLILTGGFTPREKTPNYLRPSSIAELQTLLKWSPDRIPLISAHRGGAAPSYPENCLATFEHTLIQTHALIEFDVQLSKDDSLVVMHDDKVDRTTNGAGMVRDLTYTQLRLLRLKDTQGRLTHYQIPTLTEVLQWARKKTILKLDSKRGVPYTLITAAVQRFKSQAYTIVITYSADQAVAYHQLDSNLVLSVNIRNTSDLQRLQSAGIPTRNMVAFTGITEPSDSLYQMLHGQGISCILGTIGNLDQKAQTKGSKLYAQLFRNGADIITTDYPAIVAGAVRRIMPAHSSKSYFFN